MLCLAILVPAAFIGIPGFGAKLLAMMGSLKLGRSFEIGITIVLLAVMLDRLSKAWVVKQPEHFERATPYWKRHKIMLLAIGLFIGFTLLSTVLPIAYQIGRGQDFSKGRELDKLINGLLAIDGVQGVTGFLGVFINGKILFPFCNFMLSIPTPALIVLVVAFALALAGRKQAICTAIFFLLAALSGWWDRAIITLYSVISAVTFAALLGLPSPLSLRGQRSGQSVSC